MCLQYNEELTQQKLDYFKRNKIKEIIVWKILAQKHDTRNYVPYNYYYSPRQHMKYKKGKNVPIKIYKTLIWPGDTIDRGVLHVYNSRKEARSRCWVYFYKVIRCRVKVKDIIAYGMQNDIAVKALYIDKFSERK